MEICIDHSSQSNHSLKARLTGARPWSQSITARQRPAGIFAALHAFAAKAGAKLILPCLALFFCLPSLRADTSGDFEFIDNGTSITIFKYTGSGGAVVIPDTINDKLVTSIGKSSFWGCSGMTSVTIPNSVTSIGYWAFCDCSGLTSITIPNSVTSIEDYAFNGCSGMTSVTIPSSVTSIGREAFRGCSGLTSVTIPNSVTSIGEGAFYYCYHLTSVTIPSSVTSIGDGVFAACTSLTEIGVDAANVAYTSMEGVLFDKLQARLVQYPAGKSWLQTAYIIPSSVTDIGIQAFYGCNGLTSVTIPNSITFIGADAFGWCSGLTSVTIPNSVTTLEAWAFWGCTSLTSVSIPTSVTSIGTYAFYYCSSLTSVTIPSSVTSIEYGAFLSCSGLTSAVFQGNTPYIGDVPTILSVFYGAASSFTIYYQSGASGFTSPTWFGYPTKVLPIYYDGSFESPNVGANTFRAFKYNPTGTPWTFSGSAGLTGNNSGFTAKNPVAPVGAQVAFVQKTGSISQGVTFTAGSYTINALAAQRGYYQSQRQQVDVYVDGKKVGSFAPSSTAYTAVATNAFTVTDGAHMIKFVGLATVDSTLFIDNIVIIGP